MTQPLPEHWIEALNALDLNTDTQHTPTGEDKDWYQVFMNFSTHGFVMVYLSPENDKLRIRLDVALPKDAPAEKFSAALSEVLATHNARETNIKSDAQPHVVCAHFENTDTAVASTFLTLCLKISDYIKAVEDNPSTALPFAQTTQEPTQTQEKEEAATSTAFVFETIGDGSPGPSDEEKTTPATAPKTHSAL